MQNYSGGQDTPPETYTTAVPGLRNDQTAWGFAPETPWRNTTVTFEQVKAKVQEVVSGKWAGTYTWRVNSDNAYYENVFQVWLYNTVHGITLPDSKPQDIVGKYWPNGGRDGHEGSRVLPPEELI